MIHSAEFDDGKWYFARVPGTIYWTRGKSKGEVLRNIEWFTLHPR